MKKLFLFVVVSMLLVALALPAVIGWIARSQGEQQLRQLARNSEHWQVQSVEHQAGWLSSSSRWTLRYAAEGGLRGSQLVVQQSWFHGYLGEVSPFGRWAIIGTQLEGALAIPGQTSWPIGAFAQLRYGLGLDLRLHWQQHGGSVEAIGWEVMPGEITIGGSLRGGDWRLRADAGETLIRRGEQRVGWGRLGLSARLTEAGSGEVSFTSDQLASDGLSADQLTLAWQGTRQAEQLWQHTLQASTKGANFADLRAVDLQASGEWVNVHGPSVLQMLQAFGEVGRAQLDARDSQNAQLAVLLQHLPDVMQYRPALQGLMIDASTHLGRFNLSGRLDLDEASELQLASPLLLEQAVGLHLDLAFSDALLTWALVKRYQREAGQWHQGAEDRPLYQRLARDQIQEWVARGWLERQTDTLETSIDLARGGWLVNDQPWLRVR